MGVNIKDAHGRTPIHSAFRSSNNLNTNNSKSEKQLDMELDIGNKVFDFFIYSFYKIILIIKDSRTK